MALGGEQRDKNPGDGGGRGEGMQEGTCNRELSDTLESLTNLTRHAKLHGVGGAHVEGPEQHPSCTKDDQQLRQEAFFL